MSVAKFWAGLFAVAGIVLFTLLIRCRFDGHQDGLANPPSQPVAPAGSACMLPGTGTFKVTGSDLYFEVEGCGGGKHEFHFPLAEMMKDRDLIAQVD